MKILLLNPPNDNELIGSDLPLETENKGIFPPLGLMYLGSMIKGYYGFEVDLIDCQAEDVGYDKLEIVLMNRRPDVVCMSCMTFTLLDVKKTIDLIRETIPNCSIILGGPHPSIYPEESIELGADFVVSGEGEYAIIRLLKNLRQWSDDDKIIEGEKIKDLDALPFPWRFDIEKYWCLLSDRPITTMFTSRGCPYGCEFCDRPAMGKYFRMRSASNVVDEMEECLSKGIEEIFIYDDTFTVNKDRVIDICGEILKRNLKFSWDVRARVDTVDKVLLAVMKKAGCKRIHYGVESGVQRILDDIGKGISIGRVKEIFKLSNTLGYETLAYFMLGLPGETRDDIQKTYKLACEINPTYAKFNIFTPFPGTKLYKRWLDRGNPDVWKDYAKNPRKDFETPVWGEHFTKDELRQLTLLYYRQFYTRPVQLIKKLLSIRSIPQLKRYIKTGKKMIWKK